MIKNTNKKPGRKTSMAKAREIAIKVANDAETTNHMLNIPYPDDKMIAAYEFVDYMTPKAHCRDMHGGFLWHSRALRETFLAGIDWEKEH